MKTSRTPVHCHGPTNGSIRSPSTSPLWPLYYYYFTCCQPNPNPSGVPSKFDNLLSPIILDNCSCVSTGHKYYPHAYVFFRGILMHMLQYCQLINLFLAKMSMLNQLEFFCGVKGICITQEPRRSSLHKLGILSGPERSQTTVRSSVLPKFANAWLTLFCSREI